MYPPGTEPPSNLTATYAFEAQAQFYQEPNAASQISVDAGFQGGSMPIMVPTIMNSVDGSSNWTYQSSSNDVTMATVPRKLCQPIRCEVCNIFCDTKDVYDKHVMGKKHQKKCRAAILLPTTQAQVGIINEQMVSTSRELEIKRQKLLNGGAAVDSVKVCSICNVVCNSLEAFSKHLAGKGHAAQAGLIVLNGAGPHFAAIKAGQTHQRKKQKKPSVIQSVWCDVCKINCNSKDVYSIHLVGKKHQNNLEKSKTSITVPGEKSHKETGLGKDLESKKRKVLETGTAETAVRVCNLCNVVCNSEQVLSFHLAGQKHAAMVNKASTS